MLIRTDVTTQDPIWDDRKDGVIASIPGIVNTAVEHSDAAGALAGKNAEISIVLGNDAFIRDLNRRYRGKDKATNVLSFQQTDPSALPDDSPPLPLGDIILAYETIVAEAEDQGKSFDAHLTHLVVHGTLHILGYDHEEEDDAEIMETLEINILERMGIKNPYSEINFMP